MRRAPPAAAAGQPPASQTPKAKIPLDEVDSIRFERTPALTARFMGQPNLDFTMPGLSAKKDDAPATPEAKKDGATPKPEPKKDETKKDARSRRPTAKKDAGSQSRARKKKDAAPKAEEKKTDGSDDVLAPPPGTTITKFPKVEPKKNGIRDLCLSLFGLREAKIKQVTVNCQTDKGPTSWRLDTTDSQDWPLVVRRPGNDISADLFLEPPPGDCHQKNFTIMVMYEDGQAGNATAMVQDAHRSQAGRRSQEAGGPSARCVALSDGRRKTLRQARGHRPGNAAAHDALARPSRRAAGPRRRRSPRHARSQGIRPSRSPNG